MSNEKIIAITMHVGQHIEGRVLNFVSVKDKAYRVELTQTEKGVRIQGKITNKLIPFANLQSVEYGQTEESC